VRANVVASVLMVGGWGYFLIQGVRDPLGGINSLWPLFGIANQMLAAIALCLGTTILLKMTLLSRDGQSPLLAGVVKSPALVLVTLLPLVWLLAVTMTAGVQKIAHPDPRIGFLSQARELGKKRPELVAALEAARTGGDEAAIRAAGQAVRANSVLRFNNQLDAVVASVFLLLVSGIVLLSVREWILLAARRKLAALSETPPVWLPDFAIAESRPLKLGTLAALAFALARELSGEAQIERVAQAQIEDAAHVHDTPCRHPAVTGNAYVIAAEQRHTGINRCC
jgi:carbon starvation protein